MSALFVIGRDDKRDDQLAARAAGLGYDVLRLPLLGTNGGRDRAKLEAWLKRPQPAAAIAWTSRRAAEALAAIALPALSGALAKCPLFAVGAESAAPIEERGLSVESVAHHSSAKRLAEAVLARRETLGFTRVAFLHGDRALPDFPEALEKAGVEVERFELYETRYLSPDIGVIRAALTSRARIVVAFLSPSGLEALERLLDPTQRDALRREAIALSRGETTAEALASRGYRHVPSPRSDLTAFDSFALEALQSSLRMAP